MLVLCKSDIFLQNLDLIKALETAKRSLISLLEKLKRRSTDDHTSGSMLSIGGVEFQVVNRFTSLHERCRALQALELVHALDRLGSINFKIENFNDSSYFFVKGSIVAAEIALSAVSSKEMSVKRMKDMAKL
eukprot:IDg18474t1